MYTFAWNDYVEIDPKAPEQYRPGCRGSIIGFEPWINEDGVEVWTIELDGPNQGDLQVPTVYIRLIKKADPKIKEHTF